MSSDDFDDHFPDDTDAGHEHVEGEGEAVHEEMYDPEAHTGEHVEGEHAEGHEGHGEDFAEEEWESFDEHGGEDGQPVKKKNKKLDKIIIGVAVIAGLGFLGMQMSHKKGGPSLAQRFVPPPTQRDVVYGGKSLGNGRAMPPPSEKQHIDGFLNDSSSLAQVQQLAEQRGPAAQAPPAAPAVPPSQMAPKEVSQAPPMPAPIAQTSAAAPAPGGSMLPDNPPAPAAAATAVPAVTQQPLTPLPQDIANGAPALKGAAKTPDAAPAMLPDNPVIPDNPPAAARADNGKPAKTAAPDFHAGLVETIASGAAPASPSDGQLGHQLDRIASRLDGIEEHLKTLQDSAARKDELRDLKSQLGTLEQRVDSMGSGRAAPRMAMAETGDSPPPAAAPAHHTAAVHHHNTATHTAAHPAPARRHAAAPHAMAAATSAPAPAAGSAHGWTLRSAQPGTAMVSKGDGQIVTIRPGDNLPGIGRIRDIRMAGGDWVVIGSTGRITE